MVRKFFRKFLGRGNQVEFGAKKRGRRRRAFGESSDSSDEDFVLDEEEEEDDDIESTTEEEVNESDDEEEEAQSTEISEESEENSDPPKSRRNSEPRRNKNRGRGGKTRVLKKKPRNQSTKRVKISSNSDDEDFDPDFISSTTDDEEYVDDENEGEEEFLKCRTKRKRTTKPRSSSTRKSKKPEKKTPVSKRLVQKGRKSSAPNKRRKTTKEPQKSFKRLTYEDSESDEDFVPVAKLEAKRKGKSFQSAETELKSLRRRKLNIISDSDSSYAETDDDFTISEEDDEPSYRPYSCKRSANRATRQLSIEKQEIVFNVRVRQEKKRTSLPSSDFNKEEETLRKKGKEKIDESKNHMDSDLAKPVCGICLSDEGKALRGKLDCCDHYFCFACIMEWAKVESRCPMCKQRFSIISKASRSGKGLRGSAITIPVRDQVYQPSEEEVMGYLDPYANIVCLECHEAGDDGLLLLCDLCDSAYHAYCVGLGRAVPEGDWYCQVCQTSMPTQSNTEEEEVNDFVLDLHDEDDGLTIKELVEGTLVDGIGRERINLDLNLSPPCSSGSVRETRPSHIRTIRRRIFRRSTPNPSPRLSDTPRGPVRQSQLFGSPSQVSSAGARTLSGQRRLQERIHVLHDNWAAQERASQQVSPACFSGSNSGMGDGTDAIFRPAHSNRSRFSHDSARTSTLISPVMLENTPSKNDIDQAWNMMEESRALAGGDVYMDGSVRGERYCQGSSSAQRKDDVSDMMGNSRPRFAIGGISSAVAGARTSNNQGGVGPTIINSREDAGMAIKEISLREVGNNILLAASVPNRTLCSRVSEKNVNSSEQLNPASFGSQPHENGLRRVEGAKDQVRSMVKAHLKQMNAGKRIDKLLYKEIARSCTHTILAACGMEHSRHMVQPYEGVNCCHTDQVHSSDLMTGCCANCFDSFVKDFVDKMMQQKVGINI